MIYTLTLNPALDITISLGKLYKDRINRTKLESVSAGGKGFNTSRALNCLGIPNIAIAFSGGRFSKSIEDLLEEENIESRLIPVKDSIRVNIKVLENQSRKLIEFNENGPSIDRVESNSLLHLLKKLKPEPDYLIISGSLPDKIDVRIYKEIIDILKTARVKTLLDTSGEALYYGLLAYPDIVKINRNEISEVCRSFFRLKPEKLIKDLLGAGIEIIILTDGAEDAVYYDNKDTFIITPSDVTGPYKTGAGDAVNAGLVYGLQNNYSKEEMLKFAIACGDANILSEIPGFFEMQKVHDLMPFIKTKRINL